MIHPPARELLLLAIDHGWSAKLQHGTDSGGSPFVEVTAIRDHKPHRVMVAWHTRDTGRYRLFDAHIGVGQAARGVSLTKAREAVTS